MKEQSVASPPPEQPRRYAPTDLALRIFYLRMRVRQQKGAALPPQWMHKAACNPATSEEYFSDNPEIKAAALQRCIGCAVIDICAAYAVREGVSVGICAGLTAQQRRQLMDNPAPTDLPSQSTALTTAMHIGHIPTPQAFARLALCIDAETGQRLEPERREDCAECPVAAECLLFALRGYQRIIPTGNIRGGTAEADRQQWGAPKPKRRHVRRR